MEVLLLGQQKHAVHPVFGHFLQLGHIRGHNVQLCDKKTFLATDMRAIDAIYLKSHYDVAQVWAKLEATSVRAINVRAASELCAHRGQLDQHLRAHGIRVPDSGATPAAVAQLAYPIIQKPQQASSHDVRVLHGPPPIIDCAAFFYQEMVPVDGVVYKVYCIGQRTFLVHEPIVDEVDAAQKNYAQRSEAPISDALATAALNIGDATGLEVYGVDFVGQGDTRDVIDVNPFPSFQGIRQAADALWDLLARPLCLCR